MLSKKVILFYKLLRLSFFYRVKKKSIFDIGLIGHHEDCLLFNLDQFLYLMFRLIPFFFNLVKKKGGLFFIGVNFILLKWFQDQAKKVTQEVVVIWKGGRLSNIFNNLILEKLKDKSFLTMLPVSFIFLKFDKYLVAFKEIYKFHFPMIGLFEKKLHPTLAYSFGGFNQSFFIHCFFFKLFLRFLEQVSFCITS